MMDLSIEAIEADLALAEVNIGRPLERLALTRAQVRATLRSSSSSARKPEPEFPPYVIKEDDVDVRILVAEHGKHYVIPSSASRDDRFEAARDLLSDPTGDDRVAFAAGLLDVPEWQLSGLMLATKPGPFVAPKIEPVIEPPAEPVPEEDPGEIEIEDDDEDFFAEARKERKP